MPWYVELQPLKNKTKEVVATSISVDLNGILAALLSAEECTTNCPQCYNVLHALMGDSINTNGAACRIVLHYMQGNLFLSEMRDLPAHYVEVCSAQSIPCCGDGQSR